MPYSAYSHSYGAPPRPKAVTTATPLHILIQFSENPNERFLFPKQSILEFNSTLTEVTCSFLAIKTVKKDKDVDMDGDSAVSVSGGVVGDKKDGAAGGDTKEIWAPVTVTFKGDAPTLSVLGRVAEPVDIARRGMEDAMVRGERGGEGFLALRLPVETMEVEIDGT